MRTINIIGTGNVAWHLANALQGLSHYKLLAVAGRSEKALHDFKKLRIRCLKVNQLTPADCTIIAVSDNAIAQVSENIPYNSGIIVHTSGSVAISTLSRFEDYGVFYPLQSFSKEDSISFSEIPICLEVAKEGNKEVLENLALSLSKKIHHISSAQRAQLHLAAVFVNNFANHCFTMGLELCEKYKLSFDLLKPLISKTVEKALHNNPSLSQTGPAKRNDTKTITTHLDLLEHSDYKDVYATISKAITNHYGKKL